MTERQLKLLYDIKMAIDEIESFFETEPETYANYSTNSILRRAVERNLEIIGEAMNRLLKENPEFTIENAARIIGLRNQIIHGYDSISDENIWSIVTFHLPKLKFEVNSLINK
ncbi:MAG TPA: DUF86 domain-containing protein [Bacteroidales bacterium]|nr:DUF86 domain-containing protein [Bacteroidales bacterium]HOU96512.1 DUF86 domain-containing protein [Bacteroidales bacterium]HQG36874.1 DUF86 domain-containing protein [Bacteroidales bacterium]HQG53450.1 DUF86 domain-containing protein [Bacteroidales bacterium]HQJ21319.1 DUF86 domain-containing protein [Bacteroidales bacterium]